jgi:tripartite-type tricarboxylate transporter receptor subunit TctC
MLIGGTCVAPLVSAAQEYPVKPVRLVVATSAGGGTDIAARLVSPKLTEFFGRQVVIENRGGASTTIGGEHVARAAPDGYTLLMGVSSLAILPFIVARMPYKPEDFTPITQVATSPNIIIAHPSLPAKTTKELITLARARPGQLNIAAGGAGSSQHLAIALFVSMTGVNILHVPYKGTGMAMIDVVAGHVHLMMANIIQALPIIRNGRLNAIGVTGLTRATVAPNIPTIAENGVPGYEVVQWYGMLAPAQTSRDIINKVRTGTVRALQDPVVKERFIADGAETVGNTPEEFAAIIAADLKKWAKVVKDAGIKPQQLGSF